MSDPAEIRLASRAFTAVMAPLAVGSSADRASRTTWCCANASNWLTLTRGLFLSADLFRLLAGQCSLRPGIWRRARRGLAPID